MAIYDVESAPTQAAFNSIYFVRGPQSKGAHPVRVTDWNSQHAATRWVRTRDVSVRNAASLSVRPTDTVLAYGEGHPEIPLIVAREQNRHKVLIVGFDPHDSNFPQQSAFPLLIAGAVEWLDAPYRGRFRFSFRRRTRSAGFRHSNRFTFGRRRAFCAQRLESALARARCRPVPRPGSESLHHVRRERPTAFAGAAHYSNGCGIGANSRRIRPVSGNLFVAMARAVGDGGALGGVVALLLAARQPAGRIDSAIGIASEPAATCSAPECAETRHRETWHRERRRA